jgi:ABC-2 type transport system permease protein
MKDWIADQSSLLAAFYRASFIELTKSPKNMWLSSASQVFYYVAQFLFWAGIINTGAGGDFLSDRRLLGFLVTLSLVDNFYLFLLGQGSAHAVSRITGGTLDALLLWPRSTLAVLVFARPNWSYLPCALISAAVAGCYYLHFHVGGIQIALHLAGVFFGIFVLNAISFIYRLTAFWTSSIIQVRYSNPSFKIMVRPLSAFSGMTKLFLLTVFPALFITGVPSDVLSGAVRPAGVLAGAAACLLLWSYAALLWKAGIKRYGRIAA